MCAAGYAVDVRNDTGLLRRYTCGDGSGSFTALIGPSFLAEYGGAGGGGGTWQIVDGTGDYTKLRGKGTFTAVVLTGAVGVFNDLTYRTTWDGVVDFDDVAPGVTISRTSLRRLKRETYRLDVSFSARDSGGAVSYTLAVTKPGSTFPLAARAGTTATGTASISIPLRLRGSRTVKITIVAADPVGNERSVASTVRAPA